MRKASQMLCRYTDVLHGIAMPTYITTPETRAADIMAVMLITRTACRHMDFVRLYTAWLAAVSKSVCRLQHGTFIVSDIAHYRKHSSLSGLIIEELNQHSSGEEMNYAKCARCDC